MTMFLMSPTLDGARIRWCAKLSAGRVTGRAGTVNEACDQIERAAAIDADHEEKA